MTKTQLLEAKRLAWIDLETTGLRPGKDAILEIGVIITDGTLRELASECWVIQPSLPVPIHEIDPKAMEMHHSNGLWVESLSSKISLGNTVLFKVIDFLNKHSYGTEKMICCGSTVGFDRAFLKAQAPKLDDAFHYRSIDVSSVKLLVQMFMPLEAGQRPREEKKHRTLSDLRDSIAELKFYVACLGWLPCDDVGYGLFIWSQQGRKKDTVVQVVSADEGYSNADQSFVAADAIPKLAGDPR